MHTMTETKFRKDWAEYLTALACLPLEKQLWVRRVAGNDLSRRSPGQGVSSSDINHRLFSIWKQSGETLGNFCFALLEMEDNNNNQ